MRWSRFHFCPFEGVCPCVHTVCQINSVNCKTVGAYRIRPPWRRKWMFDGDNVFAAIVSFSLISGRMRYAPTLVRLIFGVYWMVCLFHFRPRQGVCDTPLHLFGWNRGYIGLCVGSVFAHFRAYAIRPYTCSIDFLGMLDWGLVPFSLTLGRMRYAPTHVRL